MLRADWLRGSIRTIHEEIRDAVTLACESSPLANLSAVVEDGAGDTIYAVDRMSEMILVDLFEWEIAAHVRIVLIAEGLSGGKESF